MTTTTITATRAPRWWTRTESYGGRAGACKRDLKFGQPRFDGTRNAVEIIEEAGR